MMTTGLSLRPSDRRRRLCFSVSLGISRNSVSIEKRPQSITPRRRRFRVAASPFNAVKLDVIVIGCVGVLLAAWLQGARAPSAVQLLSLGGYGVAGAFWVVVRVRRILKRHTAPTPLAAAPLLTQSPISFFVLVFVLFVL